MEQGGFHNFHKAFQAVCDLLSEIQKKNEMCVGSFATLRRNNIGKKESRSKTMLNHHCHDLRTLTHLNKEKRIPTKQEDWTYEIFSEGRHHWPLVLTCWEETTQVDFFPSTISTFNSVRNCEVCHWNISCNTVMTVTRCKTHNRKPEVVYAVLRKIRQMKPRISFMSKGISWDWSQLLISTCPRVSSSWSKLDNLAADVTLLSPLHAAMWVPVILSF